MHETIRGLYEGIFDPDAWQRSLAALCEKSGSAQAAIVVLDTGRERVLVSQVVNSLPEVVAADHAHYAALDQALLYAPEMPVGGGISLRASRRRTPCAACRCAASCSRISACRR